MVSQSDLAQQLRKRPEAVVTALNLLLHEQKIQTRPAERLLETQGVIVSRINLVMLPFSFVVL